MNESRRCASKAQLILRTKSRSVNTGIPSVHAVRTWRVRKLLIQVVNGAQEAWAAGSLYDSEAESE